MSFALGDEVLAHRNRYDLGLLNGDRGVVRGATARRLSVGLEDGRSVEVPAEYIDDGHLTHGYATTVHKAQGMTSIGRWSSATTPSPWSWATRASLAVELGTSCTSWHPPMRKRMAARPRSIRSPTSRARFTAAEPKTAAIDVIEPAASER